MPTDPGLLAVLGDRAAVARYWAKVRLVAGSDCLWWTGAISGRGHGRFWVTARSNGRGHVIVAHRFAWAIAYGPADLASHAVLGHRCDNPLCQNVEHLEPSDAARNAHDWRGAYGRAKALRDALRAGADVEAAITAGDSDRDQLGLF